MASRLSAWAGLVHAKLVLAGVTIPQRDDLEALSRHDLKQRIVWLTTGGTIEQPLQAGGRTADSGTSRRVTACRVRVEAVEAHIFGGTREETEAILDSVIAAICDVSTVVEMPRYRWPNEQREHNGKILRVHECVLFVDLRLPVSSEVSPLTLITSSEDVCGTLQPDGSIVPQDEVPP